MDKVREKAIEQMTEHLVRLYCKPGGCDACNLIDEYDSLPLSCEDYLSYRKMAETFYNAGYRKKEEAVKEVFDEIYVSLPDFASVMADDGFMEKLSELKKKYVGK